MLIDIEKEAQRLCSNRLIVDDEQVAAFEETVERITSLSDPKHIALLCLGFDDATEQHEVMFGLVHAVESYDAVAGAEVATTYFINTLPLLLPHASDWAEILLLRILNNNESRVLLRRLLKATSSDSQQVVTSILKKLAEKKPKQFQQKVEEVLT